MIVLGWWVFSAFLDMVDSLVVLLVHCAHLMLFVDWRDHAVFIFVYLIYYECYNVFLFYICIIIDVMCFICLWFSFFICQFNVFILIVIVCYYCYVCFFFLSVIVSFYVFICICYFYMCIVFMFMILSSMLCFVAFYLGYYVDSFD